MFYKNILFFYIFVLLINKKIYFISIRNNLEPSIPYKFLKFANLKKI